MGDCVCSCESVQPTCLVVVSLRSNEPHFKIDDLLLFSRAGATCVAAFLAIDGALWTAVHREMHFPAAERLASSWIFRFWERYHRQHHDAPKTNFNVICPLFDHLFGTYGGLAPLKTL